MRARSITALGLALALLSQACKSAPAEPRTPLPDGWDTLEPYAFEALLARVAAPEGRVVYYDAPGYDALTAALEAMDETSVRAALLFAHSRHWKAATRLLRRLERRIEGPTRESDAGDVVAAAAIPTFPYARDRYLENLRRLAAGRRPHPDLEVRVECACSTLALGDDTPIPFLLQVLRIDTYAGLADDRDFTTSEHTAWARGRAAAALSTRAGIPCAYAPDASIADREREAARLERLLLAGSG